MRVAGLGFSAVLIAAGAILKYAVTYDAEGVDLSNVGVILMIVGAGFGLLSLAMAVAGRRTSVHTERQAVVDGRPVHEERNEVYVDNAVR